MKTNCKILHSTTSGSTAQFAVIITTTQKTHAGSITTQAYAKIGMIMAIVCSETVAYICTTEAITKLDGSWRKTSKSQRGKDGSAL